MKKKIIKEAIKDILWMARRYANGRKTYAPGMFNDAYDVLRIEFDDEIDDNFAEDMTGKKFYDISIETSSEHPYALHANENAQMNQNIVNRLFYKKPGEKVNKGL